MLNGDELVAYSPCDGTALQAGCDGSSSHTQANQAFDSRKSDPGASLVVVSANASSPLLVDVETAHCTPEALHTGGTVPSENSSVAPTEVGMSPVLHTSRKYGALLLSVPIASQRTLSPELVGVVVEDGVTSYGGRVNDGGVLSTVRLVVAVCADTRCNSCCPTSTIKANIKTANPVIAAKTEILPAVFM